MSDAAAAQNVIDMLNDMDADPARDGYVVTILDNNRDPKLYGACHGTTTTVLGAQVFRDADAAIAAASSRNTLKGIRYGFAMVEHVSDAIQRERDAMTDTLRREVAA